MPIQLNWLEYLLGMEKVEGSTPFIGSKLCTLRIIGNYSGFVTQGHRFESGRVLNKKDLIEVFSYFITNSLNSILFTIVFIFLNKLVPFTCNPQFL